MPPSEIRFQEQSASTFPLILGVLTTLISFTLALVGFIKKWYFAELPHLFFGLLILSAVAALLTVPLVLEWAGNGGREEAQEEVKRPHFETPPSQMSPESVCAVLGTSSVAGLPHSEVTARQQEYGPNTVPLNKPPGFWSFFFKEIYEPTQLLLLAVGVLYALFGGLSEAATAFGVILLMAGAEVHTEWRAKRALGALASSAPSFARVRRHGRALQILKKELVPGDVVLLRTGDELPADVRLLETHSLDIDESSLSGESAPVAKDAAAIQGTGESPDLSGTALAGTVVTRGKATGVVVATGSATESGRVMRMVKRAKEKKTPLQALLKEVAGTLSLLAIGLSSGAVLVGLLRGQPWQNVLLTGLSLLFATIPEELPILIAVTLAVSSQALSLRSIFVKRLRAAESLAYVDTILTDKTGTLTHNKLRLEEVWSPGGEEHGRSVSLAISLLRAWLFMSSLGDRGTADPPSLEEAFPDVEALVSANELDAFDTAVVEGVAKFDATDRTTAVEGAPAVIGTGDALGLKMTRALLEEKRIAKLVEEKPFDSRTKMAARTFETGRPKGPTVATTFYKGAPEYLLTLCGGKEKHREASARIEHAAKAGLRLIGYASRGENESPSFLGFLAFADPVRVDAPSAVALCQGAGIRVVVVSGDHVDTVAAIAHKVSITRNDVESGSSAVDCATSSLGDLSSEALQALVAENSVFGRTSPSDKLSLLTALQETGHVVLATGDGTNDAPILASADVGVAMGRGTDVARASCSIVLMDDAFAGVTLALREGRRMFANLRKALAFYLGAKAGLLTIFAAGSLVSRFPLRPLHIIILELFMDLGASTAFVVEPADSDVMVRGPERWCARFFDREMLTWIATSAGCMAACVLTCYGYGLALLDEQSAQTLAFLAWLLGHVLLALNMRTFQQPLCSKGLVSNVAMLVWFAAAFLFATACVFVPQIASVLKLARLDVSSALIVLVSTSVLTCWVEVGKILTWTKKRAGGDVSGDRGLLQPLLS